MISPEQALQLRKKYNISPVSAPTPSQQAPAQQGFLGEAKSRISDTAGQMGQQFRGEGEFTGQSDIRKATGVVAQGSAVPLGLAKDVLPEPVEQGLEKVGQGIGKGLQWIADKTTPQFLVDLLLNTLMQLKHLRKVLEQLPISEKFQEIF